MFFFLRKRWRRVNEKGNRSPTEYVYQFKPRERERERERESRLKNSWNIGRRSSECINKGFVRRSESGLYRGSRQFTVSACVKLPRYA